MGIVIPNLLNWPDSVVVLDVKRENWQRTAGFRQAGGQEVWLFDPLTTDGRTARYNPLSYINRDDQVAVIDELQKIALMLFPSPDRGDPFWAESARTGFIGTGAYIAAMPHRYVHDRRNLSPDDTRRSKNDAAQAGGGSRHGRGPAFHALRQCHC
ncbi:type IV secretory system conjugative DNA transfer family protein [Sphingobium scionense]